jgi:hypothetical protein
MVGCYTPVTVDAGVSRGDHPGVLFVAARTGEVAVTAYAVETGDIVMTRCTIHERFNLELIDVAFIAFHRHHGSGGIDAVTRCALQRREVAHLMAAVAENPAVLAFEGQEMPDFRS